jgi:hypothetical protein
MGYVQRDQTPPSLQSTCPRCEGPARLLAALEGPTEEAGYQLVNCERCGRRERMNTAPRRAAPLPKYRPGIMAQRSRT